MIFLLRNTDTEKIIYLCEEKEYTVGRKDCDILLENDASISRKHAVIKVAEGDKVIFWDCKSKYHTLLNHKEVEPETEINLNHMDLIHFGILKNKYCFESYANLVAASGLNIEKKRILKQNLAKCKGKYVEKWSDKCTHLTVDRLTLTVKVLQALIDEKPIVTLDYWNDYADCMDKKLPPPKIEKYNKPAVAEQLLRSDFQYKIDPRRRKLFDNKMFIFLKTNTKNQMEEVIKSCGGKCFSWEEEPKTLFDINRSPNEHLIITTDNDEKNISYESIIKELSKEKKRPIPINEIALAIIHCSCDINCNPNFNKISEVFGAQTQKQSSNDVLALETQSDNMFSENLDIKKEKIIPSSLEDDCMGAISLTETPQRDINTTKRPSGTRTEEKAAKKPKLNIQMNKCNDKDGKQIISTPQDKEVNSKSPDKSPKIKPGPSQKRKALDEIDTEPSRKLNPFGLIKPSNKKRNISEVNPFELAKISKSSKSISPSKDENPFASIINVSSRKSSIKVENIIPKEENYEILKNVSKKPDTSIMSSIKKSFMNVSWLSKNTVKSPVIKEESSELIEIIKAFKDCVKVEILPVIERTTTNISESIDTVGTRKNFKKFKKVKPLKPQITILNHQIFKKIAPGDVTGIVVDVIDSDDESSAENSKKMKVVKPVGKRFVL